jgi:hypothetical protein
VKVAGTASVTQRRGQPEDGVRVGQKLLRREGDALGEAAPEPSALDQSVQGSRPAQFVFPQQPSLSLPEPGVRISDAVAQLDLDADELGAVGVAVLFQPVGVDQSGRIIVGVLDDGLQKGFIVGHGCFCKTRG